MATVSGAFLFMNLSLRRLQPRAASTLKPQPCLHALRVPTLYDLVMQTLADGFRFADLLRQMNQSRNGTRICGNKSPKMQFSETSQATSKKCKEDKCKLF